MKGIWPIVKKRADMSETGNENTRRGGQDHRKCEQLVRELQIGIARDEKICRKKMHMPSVAFPKSVFGFSQRVYTNLQISTRLIIYLDILLSLSLPLL